MPASVPFYIHENDPPAKREILRAAMKLFSERGLAATSIRDIADESGYTNPALYKHFASKEGLAMYLFETCHQQVWTSCAAALNATKDFDGKVEAYIGRSLQLVDEYPEVIAFLSDSSRVLWPKAGPKARQQTMISPRIARGRPCGRRQPAGDDRATGPHDSGRRRSGTRDTLDCRPRGTVQKGSCVIFSPVFLFTELAVANYKR
jgi:AcrR family transcriptional regulator